MNIFEFLNKNLALFLFFLNEEHIFNIEKFMKKLKVIQTNGE